MNNDYILEENLDAFLDYLYNEKKEIWDTVTAESTLPEIDISQVDIPRIDRTCSYPPELSNKEIIKRECKQILVTMSATVDSYLERYFSQSFFKDYKKIQFLGKLYSFPGAEDNIDKYKFEQALEQLENRSTSFISFFKKYLKDYFFKALLVQLTLKFDMQSMTKDNSTDKKDKSMLNKMFATYIDLLNDSPTFKRSRQSLMRLNNKFQDFYTVCRNHSFDLDVEKFLFQKKLSGMNLTASHPDSSLKYDFEKRFTVDDFITLKTFFAVLSSDNDSVEFSVPLSFTAYIGFIAHHLLCKRNIFVHCENYKQKAIHNKTHNNKRDFKNVEKKYNQYIDTINTILQKIELKLPILDSESSCAYFLLADTFMHYNFFESLNCDLFKYITSKVDFSSLHEDEGGKEENTSDYYYTLIKMLWFFDINLEDLESCSFDQDGLAEIDFLDDSLNLSLKFICDFLKEVFYNRGEILSECTSVFENSVQNLSAASLEYRINALSAFSQNKYSFILYKNRKRQVINELAPISFAGNFSQKELLMITHLLHLAGTEPLLL